MVLDSAARSIHELVAADRTVATAESLTGGLLVSELISVPGASATVRGGVIAYATELKAKSLDVDPDLLAAVGPVDADAAAQMALGAALHCSADIGLSTTGVAGPDPQAGMTVGTVFISVAERETSFTMTRELSLTGDRDEIRRRTVEAVFDLLAEFLLMTHGNESAR